MQALRCSAVISCPKAACERQSTAVAVRTVRNIGFLPSLRRPIVEVSLRDPGWPAFLLLDRGPAVVKLPFIAARKPRKIHGAGQSQMAGVLFRTCRAGLQGNILSRRKADYRDVDRIGRRPCIEQR